MEPRLEWAALAIVGPMLFLPCGHGSTQTRISDENTLPNEKSESQQQVQATMKKILDEINIEGFISGSVFHNFNSSDPVGNAFVKKNDEFALNKVKLELEKPVEYDSANWNVGFRIDLIAGEDAKVIHAAGLGDPDTPFDLEQAYLQVNAPIGRGLKLTVGKTVTLMGFEVIEETKNPNWTVGNQFLYAENFTQLGCTAGYAFSDSIETTLAVFNGWDRVTDNNDSLSYALKTTFKLGGETSLALLGYGGPEQDSNDSDWRRGVELMLSRQFTDRFAVQTQLDYGKEDCAGVAGDDAEWFGAGLWLVYELWRSFGVAFRVDHFIDDGSSRTGFDPTGSASITSFTFTMNIKPLRKLQIRPEVRYDRCSESVFSRNNKPKDEQLLIGCGISYVF